MLISFETKYGLGRLKCKYIILQALVQINIIIYHKTVYLLISIFKFLLKTTEICN